MLRSSAAGGPAASNAWQHAAIVGLVAVCPLSILSARAAGVLFWLLALVGAVAWSRRRALLAGAEARLLWLASGLPVLLNIASAAVFRTGWGSIAWLPLLALPPLVALSRAVGLGRAGLLWSGVAGCAAALPAAALMQFLGVDRGAWPVNAILFGQGAFSFMAIAALALALRLPLSPRWGLPAAAVAGAAAFALAGYRGGLLALPVLAGFAWARGPGAPASSGPSGATHREGRRIAVPAAAAAAAAVGLLLAVQSPTVQRVGDVGREIDGFAHGRIEHSSVGARLAMWRAALAIAAEHPLAGIGARRFGPELARMQAQGRFPPDVLPYSHAHSTYLTLAAEYGAAGLATLAIALACAWRALAALPDRAVRRIGLALLACWLVFALTNDVMAHQTTLRLMVTLGALCLGAGISVARIRPPSKAEPTETTHR